MKVSIITPTYGREWFLTQARLYVLSQDYPDIEWLVFDDSPTPSEALRAADTPNFYYEHSTQRISIGEKRNRLVERARGSIIVSFDDDDFYAPNYVSSIVGALRETGADLVNLRGWFLYSVPAEFFGYWNLMIKQGLHYHCHNSGVRVVVLSEKNNAGLEHNHLGWGGFTAYRKQVWQEVKFDDRNWNEDGEFAVKAGEKFKIEGVQDTSGICLHILRG